MPAARLSSSKDLVVGLDYSQFLLHTGEEDPELAVDLLGQGGIAQRGGLVLVETPHQNNFEMPLRVEVWTDPPDDDLDEWQEAFEVHLDVGAGGLVYESPTLDLVPLPVPPGRYHALITGRGFVAIGWPGSTEPGDSWRIQLWPSAGTTQTDRLRENITPRRVRPEPQFRDAGVAAVRRIHRDLNEERQLSGARGTATAERRMPGTRRKLFPYFHDPSGWLTQGGGGGESSDGQYVYGLDAWDYGDENRFTDPNRIVPRNGEVECRVIEAKSPAYSVATWTWLRRPPERINPIRQDGRPGAILVPATPQMTLRFDLANTGTDDGTPTTLVRVTHDHVPVEWIDDLSAYWSWMLERGDYDFDLSDARAKGYTH